MNPRPYDKLETAWTNELCKGIKTQGIMVKVLGGDARTSHGWPDRIFVTPRGVFFVEFKGPPTHVKGHQLVVLERLCKYCPDQVFIARRLPGVIGGTITSPVFKYEPEQFTGYKDFVKALYRMQNKIREQVSTSPP